MEPWLLLILLAVFSSILLPLFRLSSKQRNLPPGPRPWPLVGNLPQLFLRQNASKQRLHAALSSLTDDYGPLIHLRLGSRDIIVASSPSAAEQVLKTNDRVLCSRYVPATYRVPIYADHSLIWQVHCDDHWRSLRSIFRAGLLSLPSLSRHTLSREKKAEEMAIFLHRRSGKEVKIGKVIFATIFNIVGDMVFSRDVLSLEDGQGFFPEIKQHMAKMLELAVKPSIEDFFPVMTSDVQGLRRQVKIYLQRVYSIWDEIIQQRGKDTGDDFLKILCDNGVRDTQLKALLLDIFTAGTDTSAALAEWLMSELVRSPEKMKRVKDEMMDIMGSSPADDKKVVIPDESQLSRLVYLHACVKETLRLYPPAPLLLPRCAIDECEITGYTVPKGSTVMVNAWAIGRDPRIWEDPLRFLPERFVDCSVDYKGTDFQFLPFGGGVRTCPGISMAVRVIQLVVATMVGNFDWLVPGGSQPSELNMEEKMGLVLERKYPLVLIPEPVRS